MIAWLVETGIAVTALMVLVLALRRPVAHFFGSGWAYALWLLPALRIVLPPLHMFGDALPSLWRKAPSASLEAGPASAVVELVPAFDWTPVLLAAWVGGALSVALWHSWSYLAFVRRLGIGSQVQACLAHDIGIIESPEVEGPLAIGLLDRWIVVPTDFTTRYSPEEQRLALEHERTHHRREDIFCNMVALGILALNWFNPIAYIAFRAFRADQELSCDARVASRATTGERHHYALAMVKSATTPGAVAACPLNHAGQLKQRLRMMKSHRRSRVRTAGGLSAVAAIVALGVSATESPGLAASEPRTAATAAPPEARAEPSVTEARIAQPAGAPAIAPRAKARARGAPARVEKAPAPAIATAPLPPVVPTEPNEEVAQVEVPPAREMFFVRVHRSMPPAVAAQLAEAVPLRQVRIIGTRAEPIPPHLKERVERLLGNQAPVGRTRPFRIVEIETQEEKSR